MGYYFRSTWLYVLLVVPAFIISLIAQFRVNGAYNKMSKIPNSRSLTGAQAAAAVLRHYGIFNVSIEVTGGRLSDHYDPKVNIIRLSREVYYGASIASVGIACHEAGHAAQHAQGYIPIKIRNAIIPVCNIGSYAGLPLAVLGYFLGFRPLIIAGLALYSAIMVFQLVTLPVELNASSRAVKVIDEEGLLIDDDEIKDAKKMLRAAAMTYVASLTMTIANLLRFIILFLGRGNGNDN